MKFLITRTSQGAVSKKPPCKGAIKGPDAVAWPGEYQWFVELNDLQALLAFLEKNGGALGLFTAEDDEDHPVIEIFDEDKMEE